MTTNKQALTEAAQLIAKTVSRLSDEVKEAASALTSENQTGQVRFSDKTKRHFVFIKVLILSNVKDIATSMSDLLQYANKNFGKPKDSEELKEMKTKARVKEKP